MSRVSGGGQELFVSVGGSLYVFHVFFLFFHPFRPSPSGGVRVCASRGSRTIRLGSLHNSFLSCNVPIVRQSISWFSTYHHRRSAVFLSGLPFSVSFSPLGQLSRASISDRLWAPARASISYLITAILKFFHSFPHANFFPKNVNADRFRVDSHLRLPKQV